MLIRRFNMSVWFGIDFGTTNSAAVSLSISDSDILPPVHYGDDEGRPLPSVVAISNETGEIIVGREAKDNRNSLGQTHEYIQSVKTLIHKEKIWNIAGKEYTAENITTEIFRYLKKRIEYKSEICINDAVIAVPVGFSSDKKRHLRNAAEEANINVKMFISEPTAAFCSNYEELKGCKTVAVFDWGGGTLDVVILEIDDGYIRELASESLPFAGDHIDEKLAEKIHANFMRNKQSPVSFDDLEKTARDRLLMECERAKRELENEDIVTIDIFKYGKFGSLNESIDYNYFSLLIEKDIEKAEKCLAKAIHESGKSKTELDRILCVGGSSNLRAIREKLTEIYSEETIYYPKSVMWNIAEGAAVISINQGNYALNKSVGIILSDNEFHPIFEKGQLIPCKEEILYFGVVDDAKTANFVITDSENEDEREFTKNIILPICGYCDESITVKCYIDENFILRMKIQSSKMPEETGVVWTYDKLKISYRLK